MNCKVRCRQKKGDLGFLRLRIEGEKKNYFCQGMIFVVIHRKICEVSPRYGSNFIFHTPKQGGGLADLGTCTR
jgi:hypothetical protein